MKRINTVLLLSAVILTSCEVNKPVLIPNENWIAGDDWTDIRDMQSYATVQIGDQVWMAENLRATYYSDSTPISFVEGTSAWTNLENTQKAYCYYDDSSSNGEVYGALYTWAAAVRGDPGSIENPSGIQGVCPTGWHLPSDNEWKQLVDHLGGDNVAGGKLKETGTLHWNSPNLAFTDASDFMALPGGNRKHDGSFINKGLTAVFWTTYPNFGRYVLYRSLRNNNTLATNGQHYMDGGDSVRCIKDE